MLVAPAQQAINTARPAPAGFQQPPAATPTTAPTEVRNAAAEAVARLLPNPTIRYDPVAELLVVEVRQAGEVVRSFPSERELRAYRTNGPPEAGTAERAPQAAPGGDAAMPSMRVPVAPSDGGTRQP